MATAKINVNTDAETKAQAQALFDSLGFDMTTAINAFLKRAILVNGLPFPVTANLPNELTLSAFKEGDKILADTNRKSYNSAEDLRTALGV